MKFKAIMENRRTRIIGPKYNPDREDDPIQVYLVKPHFSFFPKGAKFMQRKFPTWDGRVKMLKRGRVGTGLFLQLKSTIEKKESIQFEVEDKRRSLTYLEDDVWSDRECQNECVREMMSTNVGGLVLNATGSGKTWIVGLYLRKLKGKAVFIVDQLDLLRQAQKELAAVIGEDVGFIGEGIWDTKRVTVATVQTLSQKCFAAKFRKWAKDMQAVIIDEVHVMINKRQEEVIAKINPLACYGLTATLEVQRKEILLQAAALCGPVLYRYGLQRGVAEGVLSKGIVIRAQYKSPFDPRGESYQTIYKEAVVEDRWRNEFVANIARAAHERGHKIIVLVEQVKHVKILDDLLIDLPHRLAYGAISADDRRDAVEEFEGDEHRLFIANKVFKKGVNIKSVDFIIDAAARRDPKDALQKYGRGVRQVEGKRGLIYIDIADTIGVQKYSRDGKKRWTGLRRATNSRARVFRAEGIDVFLCADGIDPKRLVVLAEKKLRRLL